MKTLIGVVFEAADMSGDWMAKTGVGLVDSIAYHPIVVCNDDFQEGVVFTLAGVALPDGQYGAVYPGFHAVVEIKDGLLKTLAMNRRMSSDGSWIEDAA